jgi:hypothetical protein
MTFTPLDEPLKVGEWCGMMGNNKPLKLMAIDNYRYDKVALVKWTEDGAEKECWVDLNKLGRAYTVTDEPPNK